MEKEDCANLSGARISTTLWSLCVHRKQNLSSEKDENGSVTYSVEFKVRVFIVTMSTIKKILNMNNLGVSKRVSIPSYLYRYTRINLADALITNYVNNDCWYDDTSDGPVDAEVTETQE
ncbi:hypothetical protein RIR_jg32617.t3 [Rhizophagus irregularis DAOM 181602=DAOM 197198]|nr:hypothetical protein RIR_jg32617.t3 [Rhizophagus irregularis DAOM 181602=DAOM 197198]